MYSWIFSGCIRIVFHHIFILILADRQSWKLHYLKFITILLPVIILNNRLEGMILNTEKEVSHLFHYYYSMIAIIVD